MKLTQILLFFAFLLLSNCALSQHNQEEKTIKVGIYDNPPKIFMNKNDEADGVFIDVLREVAERENLKLEFIHDNWSLLIKMLEKGELDILPDMIYSPERDSLFNLSVPLLSTWLEVFTTKQTPIHDSYDLRGKRIGVINGSRQKEVVVERIKADNIKCEVLSYGNFYQLANAIQEDEIDVIVAYRFFYFSDLCAPSIQPTGVVLDLSEIHYGMSKILNPESRIKINQGIIDLKNNPDSEFYQSLTKWYTKSKTNIPTTIIWGLGIILVCLVVISIFVFILRQQVDQKTRILKIRNNELIIAKEKAEESDQLKTVFLQNVSHEIRTPLNGILGFIDILKESHVKESGKKYLSIISLNGERLLNTINDILEISSIETKQRKLNFTSVNLNDLLKYHVDIYCEQAKLKEIQVQYKNDANSTESIIRTDENIVSSILSHLLNNAIKFTEKGEIKLTCKIEHQNAIVSIKDTGIGIPDNRTHAIFDRFVSADLNLSRNNEGLGLGLSIAKANVKMLNGSIWVESEYNQGSTFYFSIPTNSV